MTVKNFVRRAWNALGRRKRIQQGRLRWAIKIAAPTGSEGDSWGDVFFADDLATSLRLLGQHVRIDRLGEGNPAHHRYPDDVALVLRGLTPPPHVPNALNYMWVISHPDEVAEEELLAKGYSRIFAASSIWANQKRTEFGSEVIPLLQAVSNRFDPGEALSVSHGEVLFVGTTRKIWRPVIMDAVKTGVPVSIYGQGWESYLPSYPIAGQYLPNEELPSAYLGARVVLNDHWPDMLEKGFLSNRLFEAAAMGTCIVSDNVEGQDLIFGGLVRSYETLDELRNLLTDPSIWPSKAERLRIAKSVLRDHSFDKRAEVLVSYALSDYRSFRKTGDA